MLPPDVPDPEYPLIAAVDLAALPQDATDLALPPGGQLLLLLLFACPEASAWGSEIPLGSAVYVPAGTTVEERRLDFSDTGEEFASYQELSERGELRLRSDISLPDHDDIIDTAAGEQRPAARTGPARDQDDKPGRYTANITVSTRMPPTSRMSLCAIETTASAASAPISR